MKNKDLKVSFQEIVISIILACIIPSIVNYGIWTFITYPNDFRMSAITLFCGAIALLAGLMSPIPLLGTSLLLGGSSLIGQGYIIGANLLSNSTLLLSIVIILGILLWQLRYCYLAKQEITASESDWYSAFSIRERSISIIIPFLLPIAVYFGTTLLYEAHNTVSFSKENIFFFAYLIFGIITLIIGLAQSIPSISMSLTLSAYVTIVMGLSYIYRFTFFSRSMNDPLLQLTSSWLLLCIYGALLAWLYKNKRSESKSRFILIRNWATVVMFTTIFPVAIDRFFLFFLPHLSSGIAFFSLAIGIVCIAVSIKFGTSFLGIGFGLSAIFIFMYGITTVTTVNRFILFISLIAIALLLGFALWHFAKKKKK